MRCISYCDRRIPRPLRKCVSSLILPREYAIPAQSCRETLPGRNPTPSKIVRFRANLAERVCDFGLILPRDFLPSESAEFWKVRFRLSLAERVWVFGSVLPRESCRRNPAVSKMDQRINNGSADQRIARIVSALILQKRVCLIRGLPRCRISVKIDRITNCATVDI